MNPPSQTELRGSPLRSSVAILGLAIFFFAAGNLRATVNVTPVAGVFVAGPAGSLVEFRMTNGQYIGQTSFIDQLFALPSSDPSIITVATDNGVGVINYLDTGGGNDFPNPRDVGVPPLTVTKTNGGGGSFVPFGSDNNFAMRATGYIYIPAAGAWTFAVKSDDGCRLTLGVNNAVVTQDDLSRGPSYFNSLGGNPGDPGVVDSVANAPSAGFYPFELVWFQGGGGAMVQLTAVQGAFPEPTGFGSGFLPAGSQLVGDTANGGLAMCQIIAPAEGLVAAKGDQVAGEPFGTRYTTFGVPAFDGVTLGYLASIKPQAFAPLQAILAGLPPQVLVREGDVAPGVPGAVFLSFNDPVFGGGKYAFEASLARGYAEVTPANANGIWSSALGALALVAREGDSAPGIAGASFEKFLSLALPPAGGSVFLAKLAGTPPAKSVSLWRETSSGPVLVLQQGSSVTLGSGPAQTVTAIAALVSVAGSPDQRRFPSDGSLPLRLTFSDHDQAIVNAPADGSALTPVASTGDLPVGLPGAKFSSFGIPAQTDAGYGFLGTLQMRLGGVTNGNAAGLYTGTPGAFSLAVRQGDHAPGTADTFLSFLDPTLAGSGSLAFTAKLAPGADVTTATNTGIWTNALGSLQLVARAGGSAPDVSGAQFLSFMSLALSDTTPARGPVFLAKLALGPGGVTKTNNIGLWAADSSGAVHLIVRMGDSVQVNSTTKKVMLITILGAVSPSPAQPRALNSFAQIIYRLTFTDRSEAVFTNVVQ